MKPILFLDIDGVLNALGGETDWGDSFDVDLFPGQGPFRLTLSRRMGDALNSLGADIVWSTTWQEHAYMVGNLIGIQAPVLELDQGWKRQAVEDFLADDPRPFLWFEDNAGQHGMELDRFSTAHLPKRFLCNPHPLVGITQQDIERAQDWIKEL